MDGVKLEYRDEFGRKLTQKEAFRQICYRFHGYGPGKKAKEKRLKVLHIALSPAFFSRYCSFNCQSLVFTPDSSSSRALGNLQRASMLSSIPTSHPLSFC